MSETPKGSPIDYNLAGLDDKFQATLKKAEEEFNGRIELIQALGGGYSGAQLFLSSIKADDPSKSRSVILKLDHYQKSKNEKEQHEAARKGFSAGFSEKHLVEMAFPAVVLSNKRRIALFYDIAGQSLVDFRPLRTYKDSDLISGCNTDCY